jgi:Rne/Rng family ribonuclease
MIAVSPGELRAALSEDDEPVELRVVRAGPALRVGDIVLGRIVALEPALPAARVEIGLERPAFLDAEDAVPGQGLAGLHEGEAVLVQVTKEARADKATAVSLRPRLGGAVLDYVPGGTTEIAARSLDAATRTRLLAAVASFARPGEGFRLRAASAAASADALAADAEALRLRWRAIEATRGAARPPARLEADEPPVAALLATLMPPLPDLIAIDDRAGFAAARSWLLRHHPDCAPRLEIRDGLHEAMAAMIEPALTPRVALACGGAITIEATAAATMIDVDSGGAAAMTANLEAARAAARQIRLRNIAGPIVIDFIAMPGRGQRERVAAALGRALDSDPAEPELLGWTRLGHVEMARKRRHPSLEEVLFERAPDGARIKTALTVALEALRDLAREAQAAPARALALRVAPEIAAALSDGTARQARLVLEARLGRPIAIAAEPGRARAAFDIVRG